MAKRNQLNEERRARLEEMRKAQERKERLRSLLILGPAVLVVIGLIGAAGWVYYQDKQDTSTLDAKAVNKIGVSQAAASCDPVLTKPTDRTQEHVPAPTPITYKDAPPAFGAHRPQPAAFGRPFYTAQDRPEVAELVHNLEHGYVVIWYDQSAADDKTEIKNIKAIATKFQNKQVRVIAAPWTKKDGAAFPSGKHIALTRWTADAKEPSNEAKQRGNWQYCGQTSGAVVASFVDKWPNAESPEPGIM